MNEIEAAAKSKREWLSEKTQALSQEFGAWMRNVFGTAKMLPVPELEPELAGMFESLKHFPVIRHPLLFAVPYQAHLNEMYNLQFRMKKSLIADMMAAGRFTSVLLHVERAYRVQFFADMRDKFADKDYWETLAWVWSDSENLWQHRDLLEELIEEDRPGRQSMMNEGEQKFLASMPKTFRVYRGHQDNNRDGWSWSLSATRAAWFARRFATEGGWREKDLLSHFRAKVVTGTVRRQDVVAYIAGRNEYEMIVSPEQVSDCLDLFPFADSELPAAPGVMRAGEYAARAFKLGARSDHGPGHWVNVWRLGRELSRATPGADPLVVELFALLHDHCRVDEIDDPGHGPRAAAAAPGILKRAGVKLGADRLRALRYAIEMHAEGMQTTCPTVGCCWDADRLDLIRVGTVPAAKYLSTAAGKSGILKL